MWWWAFMLAIWDCDEIPLVDIVMAVYSGSWRVPIIGETLVRYNSVPNSEN